MVCSNVLSDGTHFPEANIYQQLISLVAFQARRFFLGWLFDYLKYPWKCLPRTLWWTFQHFQHRACSCSDLCKHMHQRKLLWNRFRLCQHIQALPTCHRHSSCIQTGQPSIHFRRGCRVSIGDRDAPGELQQVVSPFSRPRPWQSESLVTWGTVPRDWTWHQWNSRWFRTRGVSLQHGQRTLKQIQTNSMCTASENLSYVITAWYLSQIAMSQLDTMNKRS